MAPNLKHRPIVLQTAAGLDLNQDVKAFPPITSEAAVPQQSQQKKVGVTTIRASPNQDSSDYWEWNGDNDEKIQQAQAQERAAELVSADHIIANLTREPLSEAPKSSTTSAANDEYWDWSPAKPAASYWDWPANKDEQRELVRQHDAAAANTVVAAGASDSYWDW